MQSPYSLLSGRVFSLRFLVKARQSQSGYFAMQGDRQFVCDPNGYWFPCLFLINLSQLYTRIANIRSSETHWLTVMLWTMARQELNIRMYRRICLHLPYWIWVFWVSPSAGVWSRDDGNHYRCRGQAPPYHSKSCRNCLSAMKSIKTGFAEKRMGLPFCGYHNVRCDDAEINLKISGVSFAV